MSLSALNRKAKLAQGRIPVDGIEHLGHFVCPVDLARPRTLIAGVKILFNII